MRGVLGALLYFPSRPILQTPADAGLAYEELEFATDDGQRLHGWWIGAQRACLGHLLLCHGNAGNIGDRVVNAALLSAAGFDVLLFDYRGYGRNAGSPDEQGTYRDARAALASLLRRPGDRGGRGSARGLDARWRPTAVLLLRALLANVARTESRRGSQARC